MVVGGLGNDYLKSTEILDLETNKWIAGPDLDYRIGFASGVTTPDRESFLFVGGINHDKSLKLEDTIYKLECHNLECMWTKVYEKLEGKRFAFLAAFLPDSLLGCN